MNNILRFFILAGVVPCLAADARAVNIPVTFTQVTIIADSQLPGGGWDDSKGKYVWSVPLGGYPGVSLSAITLGSTYNWLWAPAGYWQGNPNIINVFETQISGNFTVTTPGKYTFDLKAPGYGGMAVDGHGLWLSTSIDTGVTDYIKVFPDAWGLPEPELAAGPHTLWIDFQEQGLWYNTGIDFNSLTSSAVPEPSTFLLLFIALGAIGLIVWRRGN